MQSNAFKVLRGMAFFVSAVLFFQVQAAELPCGADTSVGAFQKAANDTLAQLPRLNANVDKCFNPDNSSYIVQTHQVLNSLISTYQKSLSDLEQAVANLQRGQYAGFIALIPQLVASVNAANKSIFDNARNLKNYGFTQSDKMVGGRYKYPQCNSKVNDQPETNWQQTYNAVTATQNAGSALLVTAKCLKK